MMTNVDEHLESEVVLHPMFTMVAEVMQHIAPIEWLQVAPWANALLWAQDRGDSYVLVPTSQRAVLNAATTLVGAPYTLMPFVFDQKRLFLGRLWQLEQDMALALYRLATAKPAVIAAAAAEDLQAWFPDKTSVEQRFAAALALCQTFILINGGPGTGKTTTVAKILALLLKHVWSADHPPRIALAAPTGKAAAHMAQALYRALNTLPLEADVAALLSTLQGQTVHRLLQLKPPLMTCPFGPTQPLPVDVLVIDESSMLDLALFRLLLRALRVGTRVILLGDAHQLAAVGTGNVLGDLSQQTCLTPNLMAQLTSLLGQRPPLTISAAAHMAAHVATLSHSYRFQADQGIGALATACIHGDAPAALMAMNNFPAQLQWGKPLLVHLYAPLYQLQDLWWQAVAQEDIEAVFSHLNDVMVLVAHKVDAQTFNDGYRHFLCRHGHAAMDNWFAGMPLLVTQNDYCVGLFNGDVGVVLPDHELPNRLAAYFKVGKQYRRVPLSRLPEHEPAFAITVHKSQGSEYDCVWLLAPQHALLTPDPLFNQALFYTALTRARQRFVFCGNPEQLAQAVVHHQPRRSGLATALDRLYDQQLKSEMTD